MPRDLVAAMAPSSAGHLASSSIPAPALLHHHHVGMPSVQVKVLVAFEIWFLLRLLQWTVGPMRRRSGHWSVQYVAMAAFYLPTPVAFYAASAVFSLGEIDIILDIIVFGLLIASAQGGLVMTAYSLGDPPLQLWRLFPWLLYFAWQQWDFIWGSREPKLRDLVAYIFFQCVVPLLVVVLVKPSIGMLDYHTKQIADYMTQQSRRSDSSPFFEIVDEGDSISKNNRLLDGCKYPFMKNRDGQWVLVRDVLLQCAHLQRKCTVDPDICLSYSFFQLIARRYFGFNCSEEGNEQARDFVMTEMLPDYKRAFTIVEVQLAFLHDYFFTIYDTTKTSGLLSVEEAIALGLMLSVLYSLSYFFGYCVISRSSHILFGVYALLGALSSYLFISLPQIFPILPTYWHSIKHVFRHYHKDTSSSQRSQRCITCLPKFYAWRQKLYSRISSWEDKFYYCRDTLFLHYSLSSILLRKTCYWRGKMGQYSLMEDYDRQSLKKAFGNWFKERFLSRVSPGFFNHQPIKEEDVRVPDSIRRLVALTLRDINGPPTNGSRSLWRNRALVSDDLSWTCRQETHTDTILIWHIATCYCDMFPLRDSRYMDAHEAATTMSKYCAYLVAFHPEFLLDHSLTAKVVLQLVLKEAKDTLGKTRLSTAEKRERITSLQLPQDEDESTTFQKGLKLGRQLTELDNSMCWKVLEEFWAETILYVAPSDNAAAHVQQLAKGGEFLTHIWALLSNAGIMKRATEDWSPPQLEVIVNESENVSGPMLRRSHTIF